MLKRIIFFLYSKIIIYYKNLIYYSLPNFCKGGAVILGENLQFQQKTFITGKGSVSIGDNCSFGYKPGGFHYQGSIEIQARNTEAKIIIGHSVSTNNNIFICCANRIEIGNKTLIGQNVCITDFEAHGIHPNKRNAIGDIGTVKISENVWIGSNVTILKNSSIGKNSIIATGAVVSGVFPDNVVIGGIPAKIIKQLHV